MDQILLSIVMLAAGGIIGWLIAHWYYMRGAEDLAAHSSRLAAESARLRHMVNTLARGLEQAGVIEATWDDHGELAGLHFTRSLGGTIAPAGDLSVEATRGTQSSEPPPHG